MSDYQDSSDDDEEGIPESLKQAIHDHMRDARNLEECQQAIHDRLCAVNEAAENDALLSLWGQLGDSPHNYFTAMKGVEQFVRAVRKLRAVGGVPIDMHILIYEALHKVLALDIQSLRIVKDERDKRRIE